MIFNREFLLREIQELQADLEDLTDEELVECREAMLNRVNNCLRELGETDSDNNGEVLELAQKIRSAITWTDVIEELSLLCELAGLEKEWRESTAETFEDVISRAALILCVNIENDCITSDLKSMEIISAGDAKVYGPNNPENDLESNPNTCIAYIYSYDKTCEKMIFENSASNIANFIMLKDGAEKIIITDRLDQLVVSTFGYFIDMCPDKSLLNEILEVLLPLQNYEKEPEEIISTIWQ